MNNLSGSIENLYLAFSDVQKPVRIDGCPCCIDDIELKQLIRIPLRQLSGVQLSSYASSALLTVGEITDYLYFLPRILEISILDEWWWPDIEVTARAIHSTDLSSWPKNRIEALTRLLHAFIGWAIETEAYSRIDDWICAIARMEIDIHPFLSMIEKDKKALIYYWEVNAKCLANGQLCNAFWQLPDNRHDEIVEWFNTERVSQILRVP